MRMKKSVLAVDDSKLVLTMVESYLKDDYEVILAASGDQAFQVLQKRSVDIILLDIVMPVMNGLVVLKKLREMEEYQDIPVLFLTGDAHRATVVESFQTGSQGYVLKPVTKENLLQRMEDIMRKQKERLERKAEEEKRRKEEEERKRKEAEEEKRRKEEEQKQKEEQKEQIESIEKKEMDSKEILVKPVEDQEEISYDAFDDLGDILENFVKEDDDME